MTKRQVDHLKIGDLYKIQDADGVYLLIVVSRVTKNYVAGILLKTNYFREKYFYLNYESFVKYWCKL